MDRLKAVPFVDFAGVGRAAGPAVAGGAPCDSGDGRGSGSARSRAQRGGGCRAEARGREAAALGNLCFMRVLFWFLLLAVAAVVAALMVKLNAGYALLVSPPYRI